MTNANDSDWIIYGANGYTGELIAREAVRQGLKPTLAGRNKAKVEALAQELGLGYKAFGLDNVDAVSEQLQGFKLVMHCAGPFSATSKPMMEACIKAGAHYLDITGEISVFELAQSLNSQAEKADIVLCPGVGFDVIRQIALPLRSKRHCQMRPIWRLVLIQKQGFHRALQKQVQKVWPKAAKFVKKEKLPLFH